MALDSFLVNMGVQGQDVVLSTLDAVKKKGDLITGKKVNVSMSTIGTANLQGYTKAQPVLADATKTQKDLNTQDKNALSRLKEFTSGLAVAAKTLKGFVPSSGGGTRAGGFPLENKPAEPTEPEPKYGKRGEGAVAAAGKGLGSINTVVGSAAGLDPVAVLQGFTMAVGTATSGIEVFGVGLGELPKGIAELTNSLTSMAKGSVEMAKSSTAEYHRLADRNAATEHYGKGISGEGMSRAEQSGLISAVSGSFGRILPELAGEINKLSGSKDTGALARVGAGDWRSTGTDKGWMLQKLSDSFGDLPPSMAQKFQASMLSNYGEEIQDKGDAEAQRQAGGYANQAEDQTKAIYNKSNFDTVTKASDSTALATFSLITFGAASTRSLASLRP